MLDESHRYASLSIVICSFNRCSQLELTLGSLFEFADLTDGDEVIVIDNNSSDRTKDVVNEFRGKLPIKYVFESQQGLAVARNRAIKEYKNKWLLFFDDDITFQRLSLASYRSAIKNRPLSNFFGGKIVVDWQGARPSWYRDTQLPLINGLIGNYDLGENDFNYTHIQNLPYGASFAMSRALIKTVGYFDVSLGVKGTGIGRGEESDYIRRAMQKGFSGFYLGSAEVGHRFQVERMTFSYLFRYGMAKGEMLQVDSETPVVFYRLTQMSYLLKALLQLFKGRVDRFYQCLINIGIQQSLLKRVKETEFEVK